MKKLALVILSFSAAAFLPSEVAKNHKSPFKSTVMDIHQAVAEGLVSIEFEGTGEYTGEAVKMSVKNLTKKDLQLSIPAGTYFSPEDEGDQNIFMPQEASLVLAGSGSRTKVMRGYCIEASDGAPDSGSDFTMHRSKDEKLLSLCDFVKDKSVDDHTMQSALWCLTDGHSVSDIDPSTPDSKSLRKEVARLAGQEDPWYTSARNVRLDANRRIVREAVKVHGEIGFTLEKAGKVTQTVIDEHGNELLSHVGETTLQARYYDFVFNVRVTGWDAGKYWVVIRSGDQELHRQEFEV